jgi:hypothetical protein
MRKEVILDIITQCDSYIQGKSVSMNFAEGIAEGLKRIFHFSLQMVTQVSSKIDKISQLAS